MLFWMAAYAVVVLVAVHRHADKFARQLVANGNPDEIVAKGYGIGWQFGHKDGLARRWECGHHALCTRCRRPVKGRHER